MIKLKFIKIVLILPVFALATSHVYAQESIANDNEKKDTQDQKIAQQLEDIKKKLNKLESDNNSFIGDSLFFNADAGPITSINDGQQGCIPKGAKMKVANDVDGDLLLYFKQAAYYDFYALAVDFDSTKSLEQLMKSPNKSSKESMEAPNQKASSREIVCTGNQGVNTIRVAINDNHQFKVSKEELNNFAYDRAGWVFGGLVVPFKYYLGGDKRVATSTTIAPYIGYKDTRVGGGGLTFMPFFSAGLGLVPVNTTNVDDMGMVMEKSETKSALSISLGARIISQKNEGFSAGIIVGRDFLSKADRISDPTVDKTWVSLFLAYTIK